MPWQTTQPSLLLRLRDREDGAAWRLFEERYGGLIVSYARRRGLDLADAEDVRQIVLLSLSKAFESFRLQPERGRFRSYLGRVVGNAIERYRQRPYRAREVLGVDREVLESVPDAPDTDRTWEREWENHHLRLAMRSIRRTFDPRSVTVFRRLLEGSSPNEVAEEMGMTPDAVHKVKQRIRDRLRDIVASQIRDEEECGAWE